LRHVCSKLNLPEQHYVATCRPNMLTLLTSMGKKPEDPPAQQLALDVLKFEGLSICQNDKDCSWMRMSNTVLVEDAPASLGSNLATFKLLASCN
jgi:hypothetical protein